jgi:NAD(P)H-dependent flavin oxidoreductase YrpB (nitropropane dioxygenase family)
MNISGMNLERPLRAQLPEPLVIPRVAAPQKKVASAGSLGNISLHLVPRVSEDRRASIAGAAYLIAARRGFAPGHELEDWLAAENEVDQRLAGEGRVF